MSRSPSETLPPRSTASVEEEEKYKIDSPGGSNTFPRGSTSKPDKGSNQDGSAPAGSQSQKSSYHPANSIRSDRSHHHDSEESFSPVGDAGAANAAADGHHQPGSPGSKSICSTANFNSSQREARGKKKSLDTIDLDSITEKDITRRVKEVGIRVPRGVAKLFQSLPKTAFALFDSPRTLQALAEEGVDPCETLLHRQVTDFMRVSKGDITCAKIRYEHHENKRSEVLETLRLRRQRIIDQQEAQQQEHSTQRAVRTPLIQPTEELTGVAPAPPRAGAHGQGSGPLSEDGEGRQRTLSTSHSPAGSALSPTSDGISDGGFYSGESDEEENNTSSKQRKQRNGEDHAAPYEVLSPDEFLRRELEKKKAKVLRQAQKMRDVMRANAKREQQKQEASERSIAQRELRESELNKKKKRQELERRVKESKANKKDAELQVLRDRREQSMLQKRVELHNERGRRLQEFEDRAISRKEKEEAEQEQLNLQRSKKRHRVAIRALAIHDFSEKVASDQKNSLLERMDKADQVRYELNTKKENELAERKKMIEAQTQETKRKRDHAEEEFVSKINRYKEKAAVADARRQISDKERADYYLFRSLQEKEKERERREITTKVKMEDEQRCNDLLVQLEAAELHCREVKETKMAENRVKAAKNALTLEDRKDKVKRMFRMVQHSLVEAEQSYEAKIARIDTLKRDAKEADDYRKHIQFKSARMAMSMAEENKKRALLSAAPGPLDYAAVEAEKFLTGPGPGVNMGKPARRSKKLDYSPGPGAYGWPDVKRTIKGGCLPPKDVVGLADIQHILTDRKKKMEKEKRERVKEQQLLKAQREKERQVSRERRRSSSTLPAIVAHGGGRRLSTTSQGSGRAVSQEGSKHPRSESAPLVVIRTKKKSVRILDSAENTTSSKKHNNNGDGGAQQQQKLSSDLKDEDFISSDEYDSSGSD